MEKDKSDYIDCIKPLTKAYYGFLIPEIDFIGHDRSINNLVLWMYSYLLEKPSNTENYHKIFTATERNLTLAKKNITTDFEEQQKRSLVTLLSGFELALDESLSTILLMYEDAINQFKQFKIDKIISKHYPLESIENSRKVVNILKGKISSELKRRGLDKEIYMLSCLGIKCQLDKQTIDLFNELKQVRNCIVHNNSVIDSDSVSNAPSLKENQGEKFLLTREIYTKYSKAISAVHNSIVSATIKSKYLQSKFKR